MRKGIKKVGGCQEFGTEWRMSQYNGWWGQGVQGNKFALLDTVWVDICHHKSAPTYEVLTPRITFSPLLVNIPLSFHQPLSLAPTQLLFPQLKISKFHFSKAISWKDNPGPDRQKLYKIKLQSQGVHLHNLHRIPLGCNFFFFKKNETYSFFVL